MNKEVCASFTLLFSIGFLFPCIHATCQETPENTKRLIENLRPDQQLTQQQKDMLNREAMKDLAKSKHEYEQQMKKSDQKARKFESEIKVSSGPITEKEQKVVDSLSEGALTTPNVFRTESGAIKYVKILLKGDHNSFRFFKAIKNEEERKINYDDAMKSALSRISTKNKDAIDVAAQVVKTKSNYPRAEKEALRVINGR